ncbi:DUF4129 domain-containing protein [Albimonas pacifica]|uniref:DUF4129 domain-containing protein n=1 Tax=Albimonas pacifica TaxID=1114924 RepID=UPI0015A6FF4E|nr:DUF4129 domain-containing protein [Albimonas pacifica]
MSESGRSYLETVGRRVDADVTYADPNAPLPERATRGLPQRPGRDWSGVVPAVSLKIVLGAIAVLVLAGVALHVRRFGAPVSASFRAQPRNAAAAARTGGRPPETTETTPPSLAEIMARDDWSAAVVDLARSALLQAAERHGMRWRSSWTARELLARLPRDAAGGLRPLVRAAEHVQFGDREMSEAEFARLARSVAPLFDGRAA